MWADTLLALERAHLVRLLVWAGCSIVVGTALLAAAIRRGAGASLLRHFAIQAIAWGAVDAVIAALAWPRLTLRDYAGALALDRFLWLNIGLDAGYVGIGATLALCGWRLGRRLGLVGAGLSVIVQGLALLVLDLVLAAQLRAAL
ncbi:MAG: hypothetical protein MUE41_09555 [Gemmatimonadaceae bacterium]|jgi:hypothetical protein|nr:hypothetical protein [Gemmatimonadaceae bacterium]